MLKNTVCCPGPRRLSGQLSILPRRAVPRVRRPAPQIDIWRLSRRRPLPHSRRGRRLVKDPPIGCAKHERRGGTRRRGARKATRGRASGFAPIGDGRYSDRAEWGEGAPAARAGPFRSPRSRRCLPGAAAIDRACVPDTGAASRTHLTRKDFGRRIRTRRQMSICGAVRRQARRPSADGRTVAPESGTPHRRHPGAPPHGLRTAPRENRDEPGLGEGA